MRRFFLACLFVLSVSAIAQPPELNSSYLPTIGKTMAGRSFYKVVPMPAPATGMGQTWNLTGLDSVYINDYTFSFRVKPVAETDSGINFPGSETAIVSFFGTDSIETFYKQNQGDLEELGYSLKGVPIKERFSIPRVVFRTGLSMNDPFVRQSRSQRTVGGFTYFTRYRDTITYAGSGTLITSFGTYQNVPLLTRFFSIDFNFTPNPANPFELGYLGKHYMWYLPGFGVPYVFYSEELDLNTPEAYRYEGYIGFVPTVSNQKNVNAEPRRVFPTLLHQGNNEIKIVSNNKDERHAFYFRIIDLRGALVQAGTIHQNTLSVADLRPGMYHLHLNDGSTTSQHRLVVSP